MDRKERDKNLRQNDILGAAERIFATKGYYNSSMLDIASEAQYAVGTLYNYFKDKQSLYLALLERKTDELFSRINEKIKRIRDPIKKIKVLVSANLEFVAENVDFFKIYFYEESSLKEVMQDIDVYKRDKFRKHLDLFICVIKEAQEKDSIKKIYPAEKLAHVLTGIIHNIIVYWLKGRNPAKEEIVSNAPLVLEVFLNGVKR
ncbi:MAG: TetR/AcrR family transcriptional regulator [bacterium]|nr:TetR/AcrR family transcriptional regulator [bacterium]